MTKIFYEHLTPGVAKYYKKNQRRFMKVKRPARVSVCFKLNLFEILYKIVSLFLPNYDLLQTKNKKNIKHFFLIFIENLRGLKGPFLIKDLINKNDSILMQNYLPLFC